MTSVNISLHLRTGSSQALLLTPPAPQGTLVVAHGAGNDKVYSFAPFFDAALRAHQQILSLDLPGHGLGNSSVFEVERIVEDFADAVHEARHLTPNPQLPWVLLGNSLGGALAVRAVAEGRLRPAGVVAIGMPVRLHRDPWMTLGEIPSLLSPAMRSYRAHVRGWREVFPAFGSFRRDDFPVRSDRAPYLDAVAAVLNRPWAEVPREVPVLMVQGRRDAVARLADTQAWVAAMRAHGADVSLEVIPEIGHLDVMLSPRVQSNVLAWACEHSVRFP